MSDLATATLADQVERLREALNHHRPEIAAELQEVDRSETVDGKGKVVSKLLLHVTKTKSKNKKTGDVDDIPMTEEKKRNWLTIAIKVEVKKDKEGTATASFLFFRKKGHGTTNLKDMNTQIYPYGCEDLEDFADIVSDVG